MNLRILNCVREEQVAYPISYNQCIIFDSRFIEAGISKITSLLLQQKEYSLAWKISEFSKGIFNDIEDLQNNILLHWCSTKAV